MDLGWQCPDCQSFHAQPACGHDQSRPCRYCTLPVGALSTGGPDVCSRCEVVGVPPDIYMGLKPARNFHAQQELVDQAQELDMGYGTMGREEIETERAERRHQFRLEDRLNK